MPAIPHKPTKELYKQAADSGKSGGGWTAFAKRTGLDDRTADKYYRDTWLQAKDERVMKLGEHYADLIQDGILEAQNVTEKMQVAKSIDNFLSKRGGDEWSTKQHIEQTNVNIDAGTSDYSKLSEEDKKTMDAIILKTKG